MVYEVMRYKVAHRFEVEIERDDNYDDYGKERRYRAHCEGLPGCTVHASSKTEALRKIRLATALWLYEAERQLRIKTVGWKT